MRVIGEELLEDNGYFNIFFFQEKDIDDFHEHTFYEIKYIVSGTGYHEILGGNRVKVGPGDVIFLNKGIPHSLSSDNLSDLIINYNILFSGDFIFDGNKAESNKFNPGFADEIKDIQSIKLYDEKLRMRRIVNEMYQEYRDKKDGYLNIISVYLRELVFLMLRNNKNNGDNVQKRYITDILKYIDDNLEKDITLNELAHTVHLSNNYLSKIFKKEMGKSVIEYVQEAKIQKICELIINTDKTFSEIAYEMGYQNESYLRQLFKGITGQTPKEYKKKLYRKD